METSVTSSSAGGTNVVPLKSRIGFLGGGQMALALGKGFMQSGLVAPSQVMVSAPTDANLALWREFGVQTTHDNADVILGSDVVFLATKPHIFPEVRITRVCTCTLRLLMTFTFEIIIWT